MRLELLFRRLLPALAAILLFSQTQAANAGFMVTFTESASGVTISGSGSIDTLAGLDKHGTTSLIASNYYMQSSITSQIRSATRRFDTYYVMNQFSSSSIKGSRRELSSDPGFGIGFTSPSTVSADRILIPEDYIAGTHLSFSVFNTGDTLADFGLTDGDSWGATWSTGNATTPTESILFSAGTGTAGTVPEPSSFAIIAISCCTALIRRKKRA